MKISILLKNPATTINGCATICHSLKKIQVKIIAVE